jgi:hypothetical protein
MEGQAIFNFPVAAKIKALPIAESARLKIILI